MRFLCVLLLLVANASFAAESVAGNGDLDIARRLEAAFVKVAEQASQSVVVIRSTQKASAVSAQPGDEANEFEGTPFEFFFKRRGQPLPQPKDQDSEGSGIILRKEGYILTNNHVVDGADKIKVRLRDGRELEAKVVGFDERTDLAILKVEANDLVVAQLGDSAAVKVGQWAIAIGAPYELEFSFTVGHISAKGRSALFSRTGSAYEDYIQTDASINPGNSGGPLCDIEGRVIGINTLIRGLNRGIGFAIPINMAKDIAEQLVAKGKVVRPWLGIQIEALSENKEFQEFTKLKDGVVVKEIRPDTPAAASDLKAADIIIAVDGVKVVSPRELQQQVLAKKIGQKITLDVSRDGQPVKVTVQTAEMKDPILRAAAPVIEKADFESTLGFSVQTVTKQLASHYDLTVEQGIVVTDVEEESPAARRGLQEGDLITEVNRQPVRALPEFHSAMAKADLKKGVLLYIKRGENSTFVVVKDK